MFIFIFHKAFLIDDCRSIEYTDYACYLTDLIVNYISEVMVHFFDHSFQNQISILP